MDAIKVKIWNMGAIKAANRMGGYHFFDRDTMRFFKSRVLPAVYRGCGGIFFIASECGPSGIRKFSVRKFNALTYNIDTVGDFNSIATLKEAKKLAEIYATGI